MAERFVRLHQRRLPLVLVHDWDAAGAVALERDGAPAIGISNHDVGEIARICNAVRVPVSVDLGSWAGAAQELCALVDRLIDIGVAGVDVADAHVAMLRALASRKQALLFINARLDTRRHHETVERARRSAAEGASGVFVPRLNPFDIPSVAHAVSLPVTVAAERWGPTVLGLARAGVRRVNVSPLNQGDWDGSPSVC